MSSLSSTISIFFLSLIGTSQRQCEADRGPLPRLALECDFAPVRLYYTLTDCKTQTCPALLRAGLRVRPRPLVEYRLEGVGGYAQAGVLDADACHLGALFRDRDSDAALLGEGERVADK